MSCHQKLRALLLETMDAGQQRQLAGRGKGGFRLVQDIEPFRPEAVLNESQKGLTVRLLVERLAAVRPYDGRSSPGLAVEILDLRCDIEVALGAEEVACAGLTDSTHQT